MMKWPAAMAILLAALGTSALVPTSPAMANGAPSNAVRDYRMKLAAEPTASETLAGFDRLSPARQALFVHVVADPNLYEKNVRYLPVKQMTSRVPAAGSAAPTSDTLAAATTYDVTSWHTKCSTILGVTNNCGNMRYLYQTRSGSVVSSRACYMYYTGNTTGMSISTQTSHWLGGGRGYCDGIATIQLVFHIGWSMTQHGWLYVDGSNIFSAGIASI